MHQLMKSLSTSEVMLRAQRKKTVTKVGGDVSYGSHRVVVPMAVVAGTSWTRQAVSVKITITH